MLLASASQTGNNSKHNKTLFTFFEQGVFCALFTYLRIYVFTYLRIYVFTYLL
jgi:hypothetical protein